ncbi:MAG: rhodanese-like domain-containing protein [Flavobacteriales bacterium]|nr:rhodanese-like domain-containing protein [Flavobacteriales bacterium]
MAMSTGKPTIVDVRTPQEFAAGHVPGSLNIPLNEVPDRLDEFRAMAKPLVLCCRSGARSDNAMRYLQQQGVTDVHNGGSWQQVLAETHNP